MAPNEQWSPNNSLHTDRCLRSVVDSGFAKQVMDAVCWLATVAAAGEACRWGFLRCRERSDVEMQMAFYGKRWVAFESSLSSTVRTPVSAHSFAGVK